MKTAILTYDKLLIKMIVIVTALCLCIASFSMGEEKDEEEFIVKTHEISGELISKGVSTKEMHREVFEKRSIHDVRLLGKALTTLQVEADGALAHMSLTRQMYAEEGVDSISTDEFINFPRSIRGVEVAVFFKEDTGPAGRTHVSFRSTGKVNVNVLASHFGGGGHEQASGCVIEGDIETARKRVLTEVKKALKEQG